MNQLKSPQPPSNSSQTNFLLSGSKMDDGPKNKIIGVCLSIKTNPTKVMLRKFRECKLSVQNGWKFVKKVLTSGWGLTSLKVRWAALGYLPNVLILPPIVALIFIQNAKNDRYLYAPLLSHLPLLSEWTLDKLALIFGMAGEFYWPWSLCTTTLFHLTALLSHLLGTSASLKQLTGQFGQNVGQNGPLLENVPNFFTIYRSYRKLQILQTMLNSCMATFVLFGHQIGMVFIHTAATCGILKYMPLLPFPLYVVPPFLFIFDCFIAIKVYGWMSKVFELSQEVLGCFNHAVRWERRRGGAAKIVRSLKSLRVQGGSFFAFGKTTTVSYLSIVLDQTLFFIMI